MFFHIWFSCCYVLWCLMMSFASWYKADKSKQKRFNGKGCLCLEMHCSQSAYGYVLYAQQMFSMNFSMSPYLWLCLCTPIVSSIYCSVCTTVSGNNVFRIMFCALLHHPATSSIFLQRDFGNRRWGLRGALRKLKGCNGKPMFDSIWNRSKFKVMQNHSKHTNSEISETHWNT
jgi:hypothetical protein